MKQVASQFAEVEVKTVDVAAEPARFAALGATAIPVILVDGKVAFVGVPNESQLRARIEAVDPNRRES